MIACFSAFSRGSLVFLPGFGGNGRAVLHCISAASRSARPLPSRLYRPCRSPQSLHSDLVDELRNLPHGRRECIVPAWCAGDLRLWVRGPRDRREIVARSGGHEALAGGGRPGVVDEGGEVPRESVSRGTGGPRDRLTLYRPVLLYEYEVAGKRFRGSRIAQSPGLNRGVPEFAQKVVERYPGGSAVAVRYNPRRPDESVLEPRVPGSWILGAAVGVALLVLAAYTYYTGR